MIGNTLPIAKSSSLFQHVISTTTRGERLTLVSSKDIKESIWDALYQLYMIHSESKDTRYDVQKYRLLYLNSHRIPREWMGKFATMALPTVTILAAKNGTNSTSIVAISTFQQVYWISVAALIILIVSIWPLCTMDPSQDSSLYRISERKVISSAS
jgi:hypothetical protein